jgi:rhodanese-related sulfurtransferase
VATAPEATHSTVTPAELVERLGDGAEIAVLDVRELGPHTEDGHILRSTPLPLSWLELRAAALVPRKSTPTIVYDAGDGEGLAERAAARLRALGYTEVGVLAGGTARWRAEGRELFTGINVLSKAFGEVVEHAYGTPSLDVAEVKARLEQGERMVVLDSRPLREFRAFSIPGALDAPGAELVYRFHEVVRDPDTVVVVNCAGRTRSIIGAQAIINAGVPNRVYALRNGTMAWLQEGFTLEHGKTATAPLPGPAALARAEAARDRLAARFGIEKIDRATLDRFRAEADRRSLYLLDVRSPEEYAAGHFAGARSAPGGQLVQAFDEWVGTFGARLVLLDGPDAVRATLTASWLAQLNVGEVFVHATTPSGADLASGPEPAALAAPLPAVARTDAAGLAAALGQGGATVVDVDTSARYRAGHVPGAHFALRSRLRAADIPGSGPIVLTSEDQTLAAFAAADLAATTVRPVSVLDGGTEAWRAAGYELEAGETRLLHPAADAWASPYAQKDRLAAFQAYLDWEIGLVDQLSREPTAAFRFPADA